MATIRIDSKTARARLKPRREPYWSKLRKGCYLGYRRTPDGGTWIARRRTPEGSQQYESLGAFPDVPQDEQFEHAKEQAETWIKNCGEGTKVGYTVKDAIDDYVAHLKVHNSATAAQEAKQRLHKHADDTLGHIRLTKLTTAQVTNWRDSLVRLSDDEDDTRKSKDGANRVLSMLKAALNLAYRKDIVGTDQAWRRVQSFAEVGSARKVILNDAQIKRLLTNTTGGFKSLLLSGLLTGARYGELTATKVEDLDVKNGSIRLSGKTGTRDCYLSDEALRHFKELAKDKLPAAYLHMKDDGEPWAKSHQHRPMKAAIKKAKLPRETTFYALRHTHISRALLAGVNAQVVAENCGTSVRMIEKHYGKFLRSDRRAMFNQVRLTK